MANFSLTLTCLVLLLTVGRMTDPNCSFTDPNGNCIACDDKYFVKNGVCTAVTPNCATYDINTGACNSCLSGWTLTGGVCNYNTGTIASPVGSATSAGVTTLNSSFGSQGQLTGGQVNQGQNVVANITQTTVTSSTSGFLPSSQTQFGSTGQFGGQVQQLNQSSQGLPVIVPTQLTTSNSQFGSAGGIQAIQPLNTIQNPIQNTAQTQQSQSYLQTQPIQQSQTTQVTTQSFQPLTSSIQPIQTFQPIIPTTQPQTQLPIQPIQTIQPIQYQPLQVALPVQPTQQVQTVQTVQTTQAIQPQNQLQYQSQYTQPDPYCANFMNGICTQCSTRYYFNSTGKCTPVSGNCNAYDQRSGVCTSCYPSFTLQNGQCYVQLSAGSTSDPNCKTYFGSLCQQCYPGYIIINNSCKIGNLLCKTSDSFGNCLSCYPGYSLGGSNCTITLTSSSNPNCANFSNGVCIQCSKGYFNSNGICQMVSTLCNTYDPNFGNCLSCYPGYTLSNSQCIIAQQPSAALNCRNFSNGVCVQCSNRFYNLNGVCTPVSDYCNTYDLSSGNCTSCYQGFVLQQGYCYKVLLTPVNTTQNQLQQGLQTYGGQQGYGSSTTTTTTTYGQNQGTYPCINFDSLGNCIACAAGFSLTNGQCSSS